MHTTHTTEQLIELIRKKHRVLEQLRVIGGHQASLVGEGNLGSLLKLLAGKQQLISGLQEIERLLKPYYGQDPDKRTWPSPSERTECARLVDECNRLLEEVVALERQGAEQLDVRRTEVAAQLNQIHSATHVRNAYQKHHRNTA